MKKIAVLFAFASLSLLTLQANAQPTGPEHGALKVVHSRPFIPAYDHADSVAYMNPETDFTIIRAKSLKAYTPEFHDALAHVLQTTIPDTGTTTASISKPASRHQLFDSNGKPFIEDLDAEADDEMQSTLTQTEFEARLGTLVVDKD